MNKLLKSIVAATVGMTMAIGAGIGLGREAKAVYAAASYAFTGNKVTFSNQGLSNDTKYSDPFTNAADVNTFQVQFGSGSNDGKYYNTGSGIRIYGDGHVTVTALNNNTLNEVIFTWSGASYAAPSNNIDGYTLTSSTGTWSGSASSVTLTRPTGSGHWRLQSVQAAVAGQELPTPVLVDDVDAESTIKTVEEVKAYTAVNNTLIAKVTGVAENKYGNAQYGNFHLVNPNSGEEITIYGGYTDTTFTKLDGAYTVSKGSTAVSDSIVGKRVTAYSTIGVYGGVGQLVDALVVVGEAYAENVSASISVNDANMGSATLSATSTTYGNQLIVTPNPSTGYAVKTVEVTRASKTETLIAEQDGSYIFNAEIKNQVLVTFEATAEVPEPSVEVKTIAEFMALENTKAKAYNVTGTIKAFKNGSTKDKYGNMTLTDGTNDLIIYGATMDEDALVWNKHDSYVFTNPEDFQTNETSNALIIDNIVTMKLIRCDYGTKIEGQGVIINIQAPTATSIVLSSDSLDLEQGTSATLTATVVPSSLSNSIAWSIWPEDGKVTVDQNGKVTAAADAVAGTEYTVTAVVGALDDTCDITIVASSLPADSVTVSKTVSQLKEENSWTNGMVVNSLTIGKVDVTLTGDNGDTKYYDSGSNLRVYVLKTSGVGSVSFVAKTGYKIISVAITYGWDKKTGSFELDSEEVGIVNNTSVSYAIENSGASNEQLRITAFTIVYASDSSADPVEAHLSSATSMATIHGVQNSVSEATTKSLDFNNIDAANGTKISDTYVGVVKLSGAKGGHQSSVPAFYDGQVRIYAGNTITFESTYEITNIVFNYGAGTFESFDVSEGEGTFDEDGWVGSANSVTFNNVSSSQVKLNSVSITTANSMSVDSVKLRFGVSIPKDDWDAIQGIEDYGVMVVRKETLTNTYNCSSVEAAYKAGKNVNIFNAGSSETPYLDGDNYLFTARINMTKVSNYNVVFCATPFVVIDGQYHFLEEKEGSVNSLAQYYLDNGGSEYLPNEALSLLSGRLGD